MLQESIILFPQSLKPRGPILKSVPCPRWTTSSTTIEPPHLLLEVIQFCMKMTNRLKEIGKVVKSVRNMLHRLSELDKGPHRSVDVLMLVL